MTLSPAVTAPWPVNPTGSAKKVGPQIHDQSVISDPILKKITGKFLDKFAVIWILKHPPHLAYVATLPCET